MEIEKEKIEKYLFETVKILNSLDRNQINRISTRLNMLKGRLFILGIGGGAGNASHAVNDFRKIKGIEAYAPTDNVSELTARANDDGWAHIFIDWLIISQLNKNDCVLVLSISGGKALVSANIIEALKYAKDKMVPIIGITGYPGGYTYQVADDCIRIDSTTPHVEELQSIILHLLVTV